ncbi:ABC transporter substrate-binding protein [Desulfuribacillus alkaliarsenatis]|uniref:ABC transporter substrate-binding protein n=2 Tax=Desulfuribacillus alkaliarsenatis TaxID=766136 RepID=A0A1E5G3N4_9FIRM|nr:ABC transporter substrate-binding protein [Desulfuribacillus alkaliarsenatis]
MKQIMLLATIGIIALLIAACGNSSIEVKNEEVNLLQEDWSTIESLAKGSEVRIFMWGGDEGINRYMDEWIAPRLKEQFDVTLNRTPMDINEVLQKLMTEKRANRGAGTIDVIWLNGENFKNAKENELLWGDFVQQLPNVQAYIDMTSLDAQFDFGTPIEGLEAPWGKVQFVYVYDEDKVPNPPASFEELRQWMTENPGRFTYPEASDFTGNAFLRHLLYNTVDVETLLNTPDPDAFVEESSVPMWDYLNDIKPNLWRKGETYPTSLTELDRLYSQGEVWMTMGYNEARVESLIANGTFPESTRTFVMEPGSIGNTHFLSIPFNSPNAAGAMVAINYLLSPEAQLAKMEPGMWGENMSLDPTKLSETYRQQLDSIDRGQSVLPADVLQERFLPEVSAEYVNWIQEQWFNEVVRN